MYKQLTSQQRYHLFLEHQNRGTKKEKTLREIASEIGKSPSTVSREYRRNALPRGGYDNTRAQSMADARKARSTANRRKPELLMWRVRQMILDDQLSPAQISGVLAKEGVKVCKQTIYNMIHADQSGELLANTRHRGKYRRRGRKTRKPTKATNIPNRTSIHDRPKEADGKRFGDWEMDLIVGKNGKGAILVLMERSTNYVTMEKLKHGRNARDTAKAAIRLLFAFRGKALKSITTDNGSEFAAHETISRKLKTKVFFADSYCAWQKGAVENTNKLIRQYIPKGTDFKHVTDRFIMNVQKKLNLRPREKLNFSTPKQEFFKHFL